MRSSGQCSKDAYAQYALATCSDTFKPFSLSLGTVVMILCWRDWIAVSAENKLSWTSTPSVVVTAGQVGTDFLESNWPKSSAREL